MIFFVVVTVTNFNEKDAIGVFKDRRYTSTYNGEATYRTPQEPQTKTNTAGEEPLSTGPLSDAGGTSAGDIFWTWTAAESRH